MTPEQFAALLNIAMNLYRSLEEIKDAQGDEFQAVWDRQRADYVMSRDALKASIEKSRGK